MDRVECWQMYKKLAGIFCTFVGHLRGKSHGMAICPLFCESCTGECMPIFSIDFFIHLSMTLSTTGDQWYYRVFGLHFQSSIELPMLTALAQAPAHIDVTITEGDVPEHLDNPTDKRVQYEAKPGEFLMYFKLNPVRFYVERGERITIMRNGHDDWDFIRLFLLAPVIGALLHQRQVIPLHAGGVVIDGGAVLLSGQSGAGKSTTTAALHRAGYPLIADDVAVIKKGDPQPTVEPGVPFVKLWKNSFDVLQQEVPEAGRIREAIEKYFVPVQDLVAQPYPIRRIYILEKSSTITEPEIKPLSSIDTVHHLRLGTYRYYYLLGLGGEAAHFQISFQLGNQGIVKHLTRPEVYPVADLVAFIEADLKNG